MLGGMALSANDPRPKQRQIADDLRHLIATGVLVAGDRLPSARELMDRYDVSSQTAQSGLKILQAESLTEGVPGRGTFVRHGVTSETVEEGADGEGPSAEFQALRAQLEAMTDEMRALHKRIDEVEAKVDRKPPKKRAAQS